MTLKCTLIAVLYKRGYTEKEKSFFIVFVLEWNFCVKYK